MPHRSTNRLRIAKRKKRVPNQTVQAHLVLPKETPDFEEDPQMQQYVKIGEAALKNTSSDLGEEDIA